ncbi:hypothetical protein [Pseudomonas massiliensis]|uniref:hypothetical protein n=1 Tax=Pseudomonas massiliensis TaxID=522492 RepID=UPI0005908EB3|nr:hypothetical protein [Pseudomonas massiliensis]
MSEIKHTPGPWVLMRHGVIHGGPVREYTNGKGQSQIALATGADFMELGEQQKNAQLMAASPDLLADLALAAATLRRYEELHRAKGTAESAEKAEVNANLAARFEATIAKATA